MADIVKIATRDAYGKTLCELAEKRNDFVVLDADLAAATKTGVLKKAHPEMFYDCGIAEQNIRNSHHRQAGFCKLVRNVCCRTRI